MILETVTWEFCRLVMEALTPEAIRNRPAKCLLEAVPDSVLISVYVGPNALV